MGVEVLVCTGMPDSGLAQWRSTPVSIAPPQPGVGPARDLVLQPIQHEVTRRRVFGGGEIEFSRLIELASPDGVRVAVSRSDGRLEPSEVIHDGIEQHFLGKASTIFYCEGGEWLESPGLD